MAENFLWDKESPKLTADVENPQAAVDNIASAMSGGNISSNARRENSSSTAKAVKLGLVLIAVAGAITLGVVLGLNSSPSAPNSMESTTSTSSASSTVQESALAAAAESKPAAVKTIKQEYFTSPGPLDARVRAVSPSIINGYDTCTDLENDIIEALKLYMNDYINEQAVSAEMYAQCDPDNDNWYYDLYDYDYYYHDCE
jgi:hypothetical protein